MLEFKEWFLESTEWLYTIIWQTDFFFFDFWSFPHFWSGCFLLLIFTAKNFRRKWALILSILFAYEAFEIIIKYFVFNIFKPETFPDQITDFVVGISGSISAYYLIVFTVNIFQNRAKNQIEIFITAFITAQTISFLWVGFYDYTNGFAPNIFEHFNYVTYGVMFFINFAILNIYWFTQLKFKNELTVIVFTNSLSVVLIILIEIISHNVFLINLITDVNNSPLIFGLLKGDTALKIFYLTVGFWTIGVYKYLFSLYKSAEKNIQLINNNSN